LELSSSEIGAGDVLPYQIANGGTATIMCGYAYRLEREEEGSWTVINRDMIFRAVGLLVEPGDARKLQAEVPADAPPGQYRISADVHAKPPSPIPPSNLTELFQVR
jgi:hypothetical protein